MRAVVWVAVLAAGLGACATGPAPEPTVPEFSASRLGEPSPSAWLSDDERAALERAGIAVHTEALGADGGFEGEVAADEAGDLEGESGANKATAAAMSLLTVGISLGMAAAPFLLF